MVASLLLSHHEWAESLSVCITLHYESQAVFFLRSLLLFCVEVLQSPDTHEPLSLLVNPVTPAHQYLAESG
jgi:hypothetical protein